MNLETYEKNISKFFPPLPTIKCLRCGRRFPAPQSLYDSDDLCRKCEDELFSMPEPDECYDYDY